MLTISGKILGKHSIDSLLEDRVERFTIGSRGTLPGKLVRREKNMNNNNNNNVLY